MQRHRRQLGSPFEIQRLQGPVGRERCQRVHIHGLELQAARPDPRGVQGQGTRGPGLPLQPVPKPGTGHLRGHQKVRQRELQPQVPHLRQDLCQWEGHSSNLLLAEVAFGTVQQGIARV